MHPPWQDHFSLFLAISVIDRAGHSLCCDTAHRFGTRTATPDGNHVLAEISGDISRTHREHVDVIFQEFQPGSLSDRIQRELASGIGSAEYQRNMSGHA